MLRRISLVCLLMVVAAGAWSAAFAQKPVTQGETASITAEIVAIDATARAVTLKTADGATDTIYCGPEVQRFSELKVGDKVTFRYYESVVYAIQQPGAKTPEPVTAGVVRSPGTKPGGTLSQQLTAVVTIMALDPKIPSVTIKTDDGRTLSSKVENRKNIEGVKVGDKVQVTYTRALAVSVESPKK